MQITLDLSTITPTTLRRMATLLDNEIEAQATGGIVDAKALEVLELQMKTIHHELMKRIG